MQQIADHKAKAAGNDADNQRDKPRGDAICDRSQQQDQALVGVKAHKFRIFCGKYRNEHKDAEITQDAHHHV
jgi:translation elongation factor EF-4